MFKLLTLFSVVAILTASPLGGCGGAGLDQAKELFKDLSDAQQAEIKAVFSEALAPGSTLTKAQAKAKLDAIKASLSPEQQAKIAEITPTGLPDIPSNLSPEAQQVANEIKAVVLNQDHTVSQDRDEIKAIVEKASPAVQAELKALKEGCVRPTGSA